MQSKPTLEGERLILRPIREADAEPMFAALAHEESRRLTGTQKAFTLPEVRHYCQRVAEAVDRYDWAITLKGEDSYRGEAVLNEIDWLNRSANYRIALANPALFGRGYGSEATRLVVAYGFTQLGLHRIELEVYDFNPRAQRVYEKVGFVREGVRRDVLLWEGEYHSAILMSLLATEYQP